MMTQILNKLIKKTRYPILISSILLGTYYYFFQHHLIINKTESMPRGVYLEQSTTVIKEGDIVAICLPSFLKREALGRGYIGHSFYCNGTTPLIKKVIATPNKNIVVTERKILVEKNQYDIQYYRHDASGRNLSRIASGYYKSSGYWVLGIASNRSWDSRYFGELPRNSILCVLKPIFTWE
jgi:conjugative transfer signal peptidase TraF